MKPDKKCIICHHKATGTLSPDMDISGLGYCKKHYSKVHLLFTLLLSDNEKTFYDLLEQYQNEK